jgi:hypothetical protein
MCQWCKSGNQRIDPCMREKIKEMQVIGYDILACCCGHGKYPQTVVFLDTDEIIKAEVGNKWVTIPSRKKRFYKRDSNGFFFIPEVQSVVDKPSEVKI